MHPGLVCCLTQSNSIPVVMMVEPDRIRVQEIKTLPAKAKVRVFRELNPDIYERCYHILNSTKNSYTKGQSPI